MLVRTSLKVQEMTEAEFLVCLRQTTERFLASMDAWEAQYRKFYRVSSRGPSSVSSDIESRHQDFLEARRILEICIPRARQMCRRYGLRDPWQAMLHIRLGAHIPQVAAMTSAIGRAERGLIMDCMAALEAASSPVVERNHPKPPAAPRGRGIFRRVYDYFF